jgi:hypothetical protein
MNLYERAAAHMSTWGTYSGFLLGTIYGTWLLPIYGTCAGGIYGGAIGCVVGGLCGVMIGFVTRYAFSPLTDPTRYRWTLALMTALVTLTATSISFMVFVWGGYAIDGFGFLGTTLPSFIASLSAVYASQTFASKYINEYDEKQKRKRKRCFNHKISTTKPI